MSVTPPKKIQYLNASNRLPRRRINKYAPLVAKLTNKLDDLINQIIKTPDKNFNAKLPGFAKTTEDLHKVLTKIQMRFKEDVAAIINHSQNTNAVKNAVFADPPYQGGRIKKNSRGKWRIVLQSEPTNASTMLPANKFDLFINNLSSNLIEKKITLNKAANNANAKSKGEAATAAAAAVVTSQLKRQQKGGADKKQLVKNLQKIRLNITSSNNGFGPLKQELRNQLNRTSLMESGINIKKVISNATVNNRKLIASLQNNTKPLSNIPMNETTYKRLMNLL